MTWAIGAGNPLGAYGVVLSDIQVTFGDGRTADLLRKAYPIAPCLIGAFAGSVRIGFALLENIVQLLALPADATRNGAWEPAYVAERWPPQAREVFDCADDREKELGSQFLLVGVHPTQDVIPGRARPYVYKFSLPRFEPLLLERSDQAVSIGSGAGIDEYCAALAEALSFRSNLLQAEVNNPGGWAGMLGFVINRFMIEHPVRGISSHVHVHTVGRDGFGFGNSDHKTYAGDTVIETKMPRVAESYDDLVAMVKELRADIATAKA